MAAAGRLFVQRLKAGLPGLTPVRWSRYSPAFLDPVADKGRFQRPLEELSKEEMEEWNLKITRPIKACPAHVSSSLFYHEAVSKFTNMMMKEGNKILAQSIMRKTLENIKRRQLERYHTAPPEEREGIECNPYTIFSQAIANCQPIIGLTSIIKGGKSYQVPTPLTDNRRRFLAMKWMITACREKKVSRVRMHDKLADIILESYRGEGSIVRKKHELHKMAEANRAYAHFRWW